MRSARSAFSSAFCGSKRCKTETERSLSATGQEGEVASVGTGQAVGGSTTSEVGHCATLRLPAFKIYWPSSQLILGGVEAVETRSYVLVETPWSRVVEHDDDAAQATEYELSKEEADAGNQDEGREKVEPEDRKQQTPKDQDRKQNQEEAVEDATESDAERVKEVTENAGALAHKHEEPQGAELPVTKRSCTMAEDACAKDHRRDLQLPLQEYVSQQELSGVDVCKLEVGMMPLHCDAEALRDQGAQLTDREQNTLAEARGAKRCRILTKLPSAEGVPRTRDHQRGAASKEEVHTLAALESHPLPKGHAYATADLAAL